MSKQILNQNNYGLSQKKQTNQKSKHLEQLRHSAAHLLAAAVLEIYPEAKLAIGPAIRTGFYYDIDFGDIKLSDADLPAIEKKMQQIVAGWTGFERQEVTASEALKLYSDNPYKQEMINELDQGSDGQVITLYKSGNFVDLCRGGHVENPARELRHFKLLSVAGAYWRGDENNKMLTRIYGTAFFSEEELNKHLQMLELAKENDHRKLGKELDLFTFSDLVGGGLPMWTPKGTTLRNILDDYIWNLRRERGYEKVTIPHITKKDLFETSGHWAKFGDDLFKIKTREGHEFAMKPMNCPFHTQIYDHVPRSYRDLPQRYAETTMVYRDEQSGELHGLSRVRCITQDDAHVFCRESQLKDEFFAIWDIIENFYQACGFPQLEVRLSLSDPADMGKYLGSREVWDMAEEQLRGFIRERGVDFKEEVGEAAFYGPKIDFMTYDNLGREWQVATIQADRNMPDNFDLNCIAESGEKERVVMIHAAIMGSIERFVSILLEHHAGKLPFWMAPVQAKILPITDAHQEYAQSVAVQLRQKGIRVEVDNRSERLQAKIRDAQLEKIPYMLIVGGKEAREGTVAVRSRDQGDQGVMQINEWLATVEGGHN